MRRLVAALLVTFAVSAGPGAGAAHGANMTATSTPATPATSADQRGNPVVTRPNLPAAPPTPRVIPLPNSGAAPLASGDRGGWAQITIFVLLVSGIALVCTVVIRSTLKRTRANQAPVGEA